MDKYLKAIRENICSICVDSSEDGECTLNEKEICSVEHFLPEIINIIHTTETDDAEEYHNLLREKICVEKCRENKKGDCCLRDDANCALDRYFPLIVDTIQKVDAGEG